jgi:ribonucleotide reductase alpha subunit
MKSDTQQLRLIQESLLNPEREEEAKKLLLKEIYEEVLGNYQDTAPNQGKLAPLPECIKNGVCEDDLQFTYNAIRLLLTRYTTRNKYGKPMETPSMIMHRVAQGFKNRVNPEKLYRTLIQRRFIFNSPTLFNMYCNGAKGTLSACYVTPVYDDMKAILDAAVVQGMTFKWGGGQGFSFSELRPRWDIVKGTSSHASGPMSFITIYDAVTETVKQGGKRRGANMGILHIWHPDIINPEFNPWTALRNKLPPQIQNIIDTFKEIIHFLEKEGYQVDQTIKKLVENLTQKGWSTIEDAGFIQAKEGPLGDTHLTNFNLSVAINDAFMQTLLENKEWTMINPRYTEDPKTGIYKIHHTISKATGPGRTGTLLEKLKENPYINIYEDTLAEAAKKATKDLEKLGLNPNKKNPYIWKYPARKIWEKIIENAWGTGDPGIFYTDNHNKWNPTPWLGAVYATNPCVSGDTRVLTPEGWKTAREIFEEAKKRGSIVKAVLVDEEVLGEGGEPRAYATTLVIPHGKAPVYKTVHGRELHLSTASPGEAWVWYVGKKRGVKVITKEGYEVVVTPDHKFLTPEGWKEAEKLKPGDKIAIARLHPAYAEKALVAAMKLDEDVAFALGWLIGNGILNEHYVAWYFGPGDEAALERVKQAVVKLGGNPEAHLQLRGKEWTLQFNSSTKIYKKVVELVGGTLPKQPERRLPEIVWRLEPRSLAQLLRGLFTADGTVDTDKAVRLTSASLNLLKDVQTLLTSFGIYSVIYERPYTRKFNYTTANGEVKTYESKGYYELIIKGYSRRIFAELIGFESTEKTGKLSLAKTKIDPAWATVEKIEDTGLVDFYDFTVPCTHAYIAAGLLHHNCGEQPLYPFESCNLGSMSLEKYIIDGRFNLEEFMKDVEFAVDALDAVIDLNKHPDPRQETANKLTRKVGLGIMGLADALAKLNIPYDSDEAVAFTLIVMAILEAAAWKRSWELGASYGHAPAFECKKYDWKNMKCLEKGEPEELVELHTPALLKAAKAAKTEDGWLKIHYHNTRIPEDMLEKLVGETKNRVEPNGAIKLIPAKTLDKVAREVFGITKTTAWQALEMNPVKAVISPKHLAALAIYNPHAAWELLKIYGRMLGAKAPRNTVTTTIAPTGSISIIAGTSSGIEPYFALVYHRKVTVGEFLEVVREFRNRLLEAAKKYNIPDNLVKTIFETISKHKGSLRWALDEIRDNLLQTGIMNGFLAEIERLAKIFPTSMDFDIWYHLAHQIAAQLYVDQSISKTINLRKDATTDEVNTVYLVAWLGGLKGVTVYRDESKGQQVIYFGAEAKQAHKLPVKPKKKIQRMTILKKTIKPEQAANDPKLTELFTITKNNTGEVVVEIDENSTCKTCKI